jgi:hypothetical protein
VVLLLASAASAMGQAAVDQYLPSANPAGHHGGARAAVREARENAASSAEPSQVKTKKPKLAAAVVRSPGDPPGSDDGGYPLTTFVIMVALLFLAGLAARYLPRLIRRLQSRPVS